MAKPSVKPVIISKVSHAENVQTGIADLIAVEEPIEIRLGFGKAQHRQQKSISVTMRTPGHDFELALGFLYTEGIIKSAENILSVKYCTDLNTVEDLENIVRVELRPEVDFDLEKLQRNFYTTSSCGVCGKASIDALKTVCNIDNSSNDFILSAELLTGLPEILRQQQTVFEHTGGLHAAALFSAEGKMLLMREDVGRHNALDKLIGAALQLKWLPANNKILLLSGRASFELIQKSAMAGLRLVCAVGAPSSLAVDTASGFNITLIGFLRDKRFNIYSAPARVR